VVREHDIAEEQGPVLNDLDHEVVIGVGTPCVMNARRNAVEVERFSAHAAIVYARLS